MQTISTSALRERLFRGGMAMVLRRRCCIKYHILNFNLRLSRSFIDTLRPSFPITTGLYSEEPYLETPSTALLSIDPRSNLFAEVEPRPVEVDLLLMADVLKLRPGLLVITQSFA